MSNADVLLNYNLAAGTTDFYWKNSKKISAFYSGIGFNTGYIKGISYTSWSYALSGTNEAIVTATAAGLPAMKQYFTLDKPDSFLVRVEAVGSNLSANWMGPVVVDSTSGGRVDIGVTNDNRALFVPFDNDAFVRYNAMPLNSSSTSYEVGAFYDNTSRNGLVVGSVTHDLWKSGVYFNGQNNKLNQMNVFGGATSPWDDMPHGYLSGNPISSPTIFVGFGNDWRTVMANFAAENTNFAPRLAWTNGVPFGWNSWGVIQQNINFNDAISVSDFFYTNLEPQGFTNAQGTVYINLDSYWRNLNNFELSSFVSHCHALGQKAGIYFLGRSFGLARPIMPPTRMWTGPPILILSARYCCGMVTATFESVDGGLRPWIPPTSGTRDYISYNINEFTNWGFDYVKLPISCPTAPWREFTTTPISPPGIQAYNEGMSNVLQPNQWPGCSSANPLLPSFPINMATAGGLPCDAGTSLISNTEYTLNSVFRSPMAGGLMICTNSTTPI